MRMFKGGMSSQQTNIHGLRFQTSVYNETVPILYGLDRLATKTIFAGNFNTTGCKSGGSLASGGSMSKGQTCYSANADFLLCYGPVEAINAVWVANNFFGVQHRIQVFTNAGPASTFNFTVTNTTNALLLLVGVTTNVTYSQTFTDYGNAEGSVTFSGVAEVPLYNANFPFPNAGNIQFSTIPYATYNTQMGNATIIVTFPAPVSNVTVTAYIAQNVDYPQTPLQVAGLTFERQLGSGPAYSFSGAPTQIIYPEFSGVAGANIYLGPQNLLPNFNVTAKGLYCLSSTGDCNPADIVADLICSGNNLVQFGTGSPLPVWNHGLGFNKFPQVIIGGSGGQNVTFSRYGGLLDDEPNLWGPTYSGGTNLGLNLMRNYCQARGIFISGVIEAQKSAASVLSEICELCIVAPVWTGESLKFIPYDEQSVAANGASYTSPTSTGPLFSFTDRNYIVKGAESPIVVETSRPGEGTSPDPNKGNYNSLPVEYINRAGQTAPSGQVLQEGYSPLVVTVSDAADIFQQGAMPGSTKSYHWIKSAATATNVGWGILRRNLNVENRLRKCTLSPGVASLLTPMDLITLNDTTLDPNPMDVRITKIVEKAPTGKEGDTEGYAIQIEAEPFVYGASSPIAASTTTEVPNNPGPGLTANPGVVNTPIFIEAIPAISTIPNQPELWICVSGSNVNYGGCHIWMSTDGGANYTLVGTSVGENKTGAVMTATYPSHTDPDTVDTLNVDLTQSLSTLQSFTTTQQNAFEGLCFLQGGGTVVVNGQTLTIPYELICYGTANLTAANQYALIPPIRRGVYSTPITSHAVGNSFAVLQEITHDPTGLANVIELNTAWYGTTLHFKFTAFNAFGAQEQSLATATDYTFTPTGQVGFSVGQTYTISPIPTVYQGQAAGWGTINGHNATTWTDPTKVYFPPITANFNNPTMTLTYAARDAGLSVFTNTSGGQTAYVTIYDPTLIGEPSGTPTLSAFADLSAATHWNLPGYIHIGQVLSVQYATGGGGGTGAGGGSTIPPSPYVIQYFEGDGASPVSSQKLLIVEIPGNVTSVTLPQTLTGSFGGCITAPTGAVTINVNRGATTLGTLNIAAGATVMTFTWSASVVLSPGDILTFVAPVSPDATLAGVFFTLAGVRN